MKVKHLFFVIALFISAISYGQVNNLYQGDSALVKGVITYKPAYKVNNFDNDGHWSKLGDYFVNYDDDLNIINSINVVGDYNIKYNNKLYSINKVSHFEGNFISYDVLDSIYLSIYDLNFNTYSNIRIKDTSFGINYKYIFLESSKSFAIGSLPLDMSMSGHDDTTSLRIHMIDTLGHLINHNTYNLITKGFNIFEQNNKVMINTYDLDFHVNLLYIDKSTLNILGSMRSEFFEFQKVINDSVVVGIGFEYYYIFNTKMKTFDSIYYRWDGLSDYSEYPSVFNELNVDAMSLDSIVFAYRVVDLGFGTELGLRIDNFNSNGIFHYNRLFNSFEPDYGKNIHGITCVKDGGIIFTINSKTNYSSYLNGILLKFDPKGLLTIASVDPDKVAIILYPNPTSDFINISSSSKITRIEIYNTLGQRVYVEKANNKHKEINISSFKKGNYFAKIQTDIGEITKKFIVE